MKGFVTVPRSLLFAIAAGLAGAVMFVSAVFLPLIGFFTGHVSLVPLIGVGLMFGPVASLVAGLIGAAALSLTGNAAIALGYGLFDVVPSVAVVALAMRHWPASAGAAPAGTIDWYPPGRILAWLTGIGLGLLAVGALFFGGGDGFEAAVDRVIGQLLDALADQASPDLRGAAAQTWGPVLPGMVATGWLMRAVLSAMLALWLMSRWGKTPRPVPHYATIDLPQWLIVVLAGLLVAGWLLPGDPGYVARNAALLVAVPFVLRGIATVHLAARQTRYTRGLLTAFYVVFVLASGLAVLAVAGLGLVDQFTRRRPSTSGRGRQEEE